MNENFQESITSNETHLTIAIADTIISVSLSFNIHQKTRFKKVLGLARHVPKTYITPNRKVTSKELLDVIYEQNMKINSSMI